jgi:hypothetical protein
MCHRPACALAGIFEDAGLRSHKCIAHSLRQVQVKLTVKCGCPALAPVIPRNRTDVTPPWAGAYRTCHTVYYTINGRQPNSTRMRGAANLALCGR